MPGTLCKGSSTERVFEPDRTGIERVCDFPRVLTASSLPHECGKFIQTEIAMTWIVSDPDHLGGKPRVRDTRIAVGLLLEWLASGMTIAEIVREYPSLTEEAIRGTLEELAHSDLLTRGENSLRREHA
jgi:uncharacterized protein (DUF433 family)